ncbi:hypothetical protein FOL46_001205 [Perkinsus olseni]|uniref:Uncharacterized protein n=1 Tax=Perkinsus olseni TaxID=32597 RepID=A0A7J6KU72_PEROL|nr:hypothetical protein FOL46_001205 [Perkinsus olseni]
MSGTDSTPAVTDETSCTEDTSLCGKLFSKERLAWYLYDAGNSAIGGVALLIFIPLLLSNLALDQAYSGAAVRSCSSYSVQPRRLSGSILLQSRWSILQ